MIQIDAVKHTPRDLRYQFYVSKNDPLIDTFEGKKQIADPTARFQLTPDILNAFEISPTIGGTLFCPNSEGADLKVGWLFTMYAGFAPGPVYMKCVVDSMVPYGFGGQAILFTPYASAGDGTYNTWWIESDLFTRANFLQNTFPSAVDCKERFSPPSARFTFPVDTVTTTVVTSDTELLKSGYSTSAYKGQVYVIEDQYDYSRPYEGISHKVTRRRERTTITTTYFYDPPDSDTVVEVAEITPMEHTHTYSAADFFPITSGDRIYFPGSQIPNPTPGACVRKYNLGTCSAGEYTKIYEVYYPDGPPPENPPSYRLVSEVTVSDEFMAGVEGNGIGTISPGSFFPP